MIIFYDTRDDRQKPLIDKFVVALDESTPYVKVGIPITTALPEKTDLFHEMIFFANTKEWTADNIYNIIDNIPLQLRSTVEKFVFATDKDTNKLSQILREQITHRLALPNAIVEVQTHEDMNTNRASHLSHVSHHTHTSTVGHTSRDSHDSHTDTRTHTRHGSHDFPTRNATQDRRNSAPEMSSNFHATTDTTQQNTQNSHTLANENLQTNTANDINLIKNKPLYDIDDLNVIKQTLNEYLASLEQDEELSEDIKIEREAIDALMNHIINIIDTTENTTNYNLFLNNEDIMELGRTPAETEEYINALKNSTILEELIGNVDKVFTSLETIYNNRPQPDEVQPIRP